MRALILAAGAALTLSACGGAETEAEADEVMAVENLEVENLVINDTTGLDATTNLDANMATDMNMMEEGVDADLNVETEADTPL